MLPCLQWIYKCITRDNICKTSSSSALAYPKCRITTLCLAHHKVASLQLYNHKLDLYKRPRAVTSQQSMHKHATVIGYRTGNYFCYSLTLVTLQVLLYIETRSVVSCDHHSARDKTKWVIGTLNHSIRGNLLPNEIPVRSLVSDGTALGDVFLIFLEI